MHGYGIGLQTLRVSGIEGAGVMVRARTGVKRNVSPFVHFPH